MKVEYCIPQGWRRLNNGEYIETNDRVLDTKSLTWDKTDWKGHLVCENSSTYIRKIKKISQFTTNTIPINTWWKCNGTDNGIFFRIVGLVPDGVRFVYYSGPVEVTYSDLLENWEYTFESNPTGEWKKAGTDET